MINQKKLLEAYSLKKENWGNLPNFVEGYINFGYWEGIISENLSSISYEERLNSSMNLYKLLLDSLCLSKNDSLLEIGCGRGAGTELIKNYYQPRSLIAIDLNPDMVECSKNRFKDIEFINTSALQTTLPAQSIDKIISVEMLQHLPNSSYSALSHEIKRIIKPHGRIALASYFATNSAAYTKMADVLELVRTGQDNPQPIQHLLQAFECDPFKLEACYSIGKEVFEGYERWIKQMQVKTPCSFDYYKAYQLGYIDYYVVIILT